MKIIKKRKFWKKAFVDHSYEVDYFSIDRLLINDKYNADLYFLDISFQINKKIKNEISKTTIN